MRGLYLPAFAALAVAAPTKRAAYNDGDILNYALTLEHLEAKFYQEAVAKFSSEDFEKLGLSSTFYGNLQEVASDEQTHVTFLTSALQAAGVTPVAACTYDFGYTTAQGFLATAAILEGTGVSAYLGAAQYIANKAYLTAAGSILTIEARHSAYLRNNQSPVTESPFPSPFDIPLDLDEVYSLASQFITGCPANNPKLPVKAFPALTLTNAGEQSIGKTITLTTTKSVAAKAAYFITINGPIAAPLKGSGKSFQVTIPSGVQAGQEYVVLTNAAGTPTDSNIVAGPAIVPIVDNDAGQSPGSGSYPHGGWGGGGWNHGNGHGW